MSTCYVCCCWCCCIEKKTPSGRAYYLFLLLAHRWPPPPPAAQFRRKKIPVETLNNQCSTPPLRRRYRIDLSGRRHLGCEGFATLLNDCTRNIFTPPHCATGSPPADCVRPRCRRYRVATFWLSAAPRLLRARFALAA